MLGYFFGGGMLHTGMRQGSFVHPTDALPSRVLEDLWARVISMCHFPRVMETLTN